MPKTKIEWADEVFNPVTGCSKISEGCLNCYAERHCKRMKTILPKKYGQGFEVALHPDALEKKIAGKGKVVFVCSMSDLFHSDIPLGFIGQVFKYIRENDQHFFLILTKRPSNALSFLKQSRGFIMPKNLGFGVSVENQDAANYRIPLLMEIPSTMRFLSVEPMIGPVEIGHFLYSVKNSIDWVICGGESGPSARPLHPEWARRLKNQCEHSHTPFFFKQWGEWIPAFDCTASPKHIFPDGERVFKVGKKSAGRILDGKEYLQYPKIQGFPKR